MTHKFTVVIATLGRPSMVEWTVDYIIKNQSLSNFELVVSCTSILDVGNLSANERVRIVVGDAGTSKQRNRALDVLSADTDFVAFFDDDFVPHPHWLETAASIFSNQPDIAAITGNLIADGIKGPGLEISDALRMLRTRLVLSGKQIENFSPYGCNMAFRMSALRSLRFDERLVLYGWLEDRDFGSQLYQRGGKLIKSADCVGVHLGVKRGRVSGRRFGYSQVVNPIYLLRKKSMTRRQVFDHISRNILSNIVLSIWPEKFIDRRGRLIGNIKGLYDLIKGRCEPERAVDVT